MRSLGLKLTIAFLFVGLVGVGLIVFFAGRTTQSEFREFIFDEYRGTFVDQLAEYYRTHEAWAGLMEVFPMPDRFPFQRMMQGGRQGSVITITDAQGNVIVPGHSMGMGKRLSHEEIVTGTPIEVDGQVVGWVLEAREAFRENPAESAFLSRIVRMLIVGAIGALVLSLLLGIVLSRALTRPIRELTAATRAVAGGDLGRTVTVRSKDELGELAKSFNQMSAELARSQELRRQMTADIAHELRTPLSVILGHVDAIADDVLPANPETFDIIREETSRLGRLVEDLRTLSRADAGELTLNLRLLQPKALIDRAVAAQRHFADQKRIRLSTEIDADTPKIEADPERLAQVLINLLSNAMRHTPEGGQILVSAASADAGIEIRVCDTGPGIAPQELPQVFDRFYRADKSRQRETGGSGLGLAIAKSIVELHGGRIWVESEVDEGATFVIWLPATHEEKSA